MNFLHGRPKNRREFLAGSAAGFLGLSMAPTLLGALARPGTARADEGRGGPPPIPFLIFDLAGGAGLPGNFLVGKEGGPNDLLKSYNTLGWDPRAPGAIDEQFGLPMAAKASTLLAGLVARTSPDARANLRMSSICHFGQDDSSSNLLSPVALVARANGAGSIITSPTGLQRSPSGGNSSAVQMSSKYTPMQITKLDDFIDALRLSGALAAMTPASAVLFKKMLSRLSESQLKRLGELPIAQSLKLLKDDFHRALGDDTKAASLDPRKSAEMGASFGINERSATTAGPAIQAGIVMNALLGQSGPGVLTLGGYDYHDGTQTTGDNQDRLAGDLIGRSVEAAHRLKKPLFFQILTDGGVSAAAGSRNWQSDSGIRSMTVMGFYDPAGASKQRKIQLGRYTDGQGADVNTLLGQDRAKVAYAVFANYLSLSGRLGEFDELTTRGIFTTKELESVIAYG